MVQPITLHIFKSAENIKEFIRRIRYYHLKKISNPKNKHKVTKRQYHSYFKFTFVRNPWARAFSWYQNVLRDEQHRAYHGIGEDMPFTEFLERFAGKGMLRPQLYWITDYEGNIPLDYIGKFENLHQDFIEVCRRLNFKNTKLPHKLKGSHKDYRRFYDDRAVDIINQVYRKEIELFGYAFDS